MGRSLTLKLIFAFALVAFTSAALVALFIRLTSLERLNTLIVDQQRSNLEQALASYYRTNGSWEGVPAHWQQIQFLAGPAPQVMQDDPPQGMMGQGQNMYGINQRDRRNLFTLADADGIVLVSNNRDYPTGAVVSERLLRNAEPIEVNSQVVGYLLSEQRSPGLNPAETMFLIRTNQALVLGMGGALLVALVISVLLSRTLTRPLRALTSAAQNIARGQLEQQVEVKSADEIGELAMAFNRMSQEVASSNQQRRQMTADIAHDLRTPLTVIGGYVESMRDGVLQPTPQRLALIYTEIERMQRLVGDLRMLSQADAGELPLNPQVLAPEHLLQHAAELFQHHASQQGVTLDVALSGSLPSVKVDEARMMQVMDNLISNALRYTPPGGRITLGGSSGSNGTVTLMVSDTGSGIPSEELPFIFNRFRRADKSRHSESGESGLGLAIVKALVEAHHGRVWAESVEGEGTNVMIELPAV